MARVLVVLAILIAAAPAFAFNSRLGYADDATTDIAPAGPQLYVADVLICVDINANPGFFDPSTRYADAFTAAGAVSFSFASVEVEDGTINFPANVTGDNYSIVVLLTSENWWSAPQNIDPADEAVLASYLDTGGNLLLVGQDYMYGAHPTMGTCSGFPRDYLGLDVCTQDVVWAPLTANISGSAGGPFEGESFFLDSQTIFLSNEFFPDVATPTENADYLFYYDDAATDGVGIYHDSGSFKTVWCGIELSAATDTDFNHMIDYIYQWFLTSTPVEEATWGSIKAMYR